MLKEENQATWPMAADVLECSVASCSTWSGTSTAEQQSEKDQSDSDAEWENIEGFPRKAAELTEASDYAWKTWKEATPGVVRRAVEACCKKSPDTFKGYELVLYGSAAEPRCDGAFADVDMTVLLPELSSKNVYEHQEALEKIKIEIPRNVRKEDGYVVCKEIILGKVCVLRLKIQKGEGLTSLDVTINQHAADCLAHGVWRGLLDGLSCGPVGRPVERSKKEKARIEELMKINPFVPELLRIIRHCMQQWNLPGTKGGGPPSFFWRHWILEILETMQLNKKGRKTLKDSESDVFTTVLRYFFNTGLLAKKVSDSKFNPCSPESDLAPGVKLEYALHFNRAAHELEKLQGKKSNDQTLKRLFLDEAPAQPHGNNWLAMDPEKLRVVLVRVRSKEDIVRAGSKSYVPLEAMQLHVQDGKVMEGEMLDTITGRNLIRQVDMKFGPTAAECIRETVATLRQQENQKCGFKKAEDHAEANKLQPAELEMKTKGKKEKDKTVYTLALGARKADGLRRVLRLLASWLDRPDPTPVERRNRLVKFLEGQLGQAEKWGKCVAFYEMFPGSKHHDNPKADSVGKVILLIAQLLVAGGDCSLLLMDSQKNRKTNKDHPAHERDLVRGCIIEFSLNERFQTASKYACLAFRADCQAILDELFPPGRCDARKAEQVMTEVPICKEGYVVKVVEKKELDTVARRLRVTTSPVKSEDFRPFKDPMPEHRELLAQIAAYFSFVELNGGFDENKAGTSGDRGQLLTSLDPKTFPAELAHGRKTMAAIRCMFFQDGLTGSAWGDGSPPATTCTTSSNELGAQALHAASLKRFIDMALARANHNSWDPLGSLGVTDDEAAFKRCRSEELKHGRISMMTTLCWSGSVLFQDHGLLTIIEGAATHASYNGKVAVVLGIDDSETYCRAFLPDSLKPIDVQVDWLSHCQKNHRTLKSKDELEKLGLRNAREEDFEAVQDKAFLQKFGGEALPIDQLQAKGGEDVCMEHLFPETSGWPKTTLFVALSFWGSAEIFVVPKNFLQELHEVILAKGSSKFKFYYPSVKVNCDMNRTVMRKFQEKIRRWLRERSALPSLETDASEMARREGGDRAGLLADP